MTMPDATEIARGLSPAQRKALLWLPADADLAARVTGRMTTSLYVLWERGLVGGLRNGDWWHLTKDGLAVRAILAAEAEHGE